MSAPGAILPALQRDMLDDPADLAIIKAIIGLGHTLGLRVLAEGVETDEEYRAVRTGGCDEMQGYAFARPMPADQLATWLEERKGKIEPTWLRVV